METSPYAPIERYVRSRKMENGAYSSILSDGIGVPSIRDTDWAIRIFGSLHRPLADPDTTLDWLHAVSGDILEEGDIKSGYHLVRSSLALGGILPDLSRFLSEAAKRLVPGDSSFFEEDGRLAQSHFWLWIEASGIGESPEGKNRIRAFLEHRMPALIREPSDLPSFGHALESLGLLGIGVDRISQRQWESFQDPATGFRLTPDSRMSTLETLWWGTAISRKYRLPVLYPEAIQCFVDECRTRKGGYGPRPGAVPDLESSGFALEIHEHLKGP
ncbi:MAG: hypothetical protein ACYCYP_01085 [Leptospirales bacterium]